MVHRDTGAVEHAIFDILDYLKEGDCLVLNDSKVLPARLYSEKEKNGEPKVEFLLTRASREISGRPW